MEAATAIRRHLGTLVGGIGPRPPGSPANRRATDHLIRCLEEADLEVSALEFTATWWEPGPVRLEVHDEILSLDPTPFARPCDVRGPVLRRSTRASLAGDEALAGSVLVLDGDLTTEPLFPKSFPFLDLPDQRAFIDDLERLRPAAVIAVVDRASPYAFFEDPDLAFPYAVVGPSVGRQLGDGTVIRLRVAGALNQGPGVNVSARTPADGSDGRSVLSAHVDSKVTTPGAFDNAGGVATLLSLAESRRLNDRPVEFVFFNGEDHYAAPGEQAWLAASDLASIRQVLNIDGAGVAGRGTAVSPMACPPDVEDRLAAAVAGRPGWSVAGPWYESDHAIFAMQGIPSLAITSEGVHELLVDLAHTERDTLEVVDAGILVEVAGFVADWVETNPGPVAGRRG